MAGWITHRGASLVIDTDCGWQFESDLFKQLAELQGRNKTGIMAHHLESNRLIKRLHRPLKTALKLKLNIGHWSKHLSLVRLD